ncbi:phage tail tube protein [Undibacterium sp. SXout7W]|uniref:phage tail tube protein n=1 Tax=Undibacterium sp. SXout7W TaxID=3413049 RepID=UPI003BEFBCB6
MPNIAQGINKKVAFKRQTGVGVQASTSAAQYLRRKQSIFTLKRDTYNTQDEIASHQQLISERLGAQMVDGKLSGLLSPGTYSDWLSALLRRDFTAGASATAVSITVAGTGPYTLTRAAGSYLADGFKIGDVIRLSVGSLNAANINKNFLITGLTALVATGIPLNGVSLVAEGPITGCTVTTQGKKTFTPAAGQTNIYYTVEEFNTDISTSEVSTDVKVGQVALKLPGTGNAEVDFTLVGLNQTSGAVQYFTSPTVETTSNVLSTATGALILNGVQNTIVTSIDLTINGQETPMDGVVGSNSRPDIYRKKLLVSGSFSAMLSDSTIDTLFRNETETTLVVALTADRTSNADFISIVLPRLKVKSSTTDDGEKGIVGTYEFTALYNFSGGAGTNSEQTTMSVQDTLA